MKKYHYIFCLILLLLGVFLLLTWPNQQVAKQEVSAQIESTLNENQSISLPDEAISADKSVAEAIKKVDEQKEEHRDSLMKGIESMLNTPITFYGKVVDQNGDPVPNAKVDYGLLDNFNASGSVKKTSADRNGYFTISGVRGAVISVSAHKEGYYHIQEVSNQAFGYGYGPDTYIKSPPTKDNPAVFTLHKAGKTEPIVNIKKSKQIPKNGTPIAVALETGNISPNGDFRVEAWTEKPSEGRKFNWRCRITVRGGGLIEREGQFDFEAPMDGYKESVEILMLKDTKKWHSQVQHDYFVKLPDNRYARVNFRMIAGGNHYFILESYLNPTPGSRNLEYDPSKKIEP